MMAYDHDLEDVQALVAHIGRCILITFSMLQTCIGAKKTLMIEAPKNPSDYKLFRKDHVKPSENILTAVNDSLFESRSLCYSTIYEARKQPAWTKMRIFVGVHGKSICF